MVTVTHSNAYHLIYAGGTFGSHGTPLSALPAPVFLPALQVLLQAYDCTIIPNTIIKDSSELTPKDFIAFYQIIYAAHLTGIKKFILITGTDTLSYLASFLSIGLAHLPITLVVTGSMQPLFYPDRHPLTLNATSDAWQNLTKAFDFLSQEIKGTVISFNSQILEGNSTQKIHTSNVNAIVGNLVDYQAYSKVHCKILPDFLYDWQNYTNIHTLYCLPNQVDTLSSVLEQFLHTTPTAVIIQGFGAGNLPYSHRIKNAITSLINQNFLLIMSSTCPFGAVSPTYKAGAWQYNLGVVSGRELPIPALYSYALWICITSPPIHRVALWQNMVK